MALTTVFNASPYYDDASETNDFYRILFRPGYGLQARELTQLQTLLQYQIQRGGYHLFENGSKVQGARDIPKRRVYPAFGPVRVVLLEPVEQDARDQPND